jgi:DNA helicase II / ATP-dependent DNA helicase PcrA
VITDMTLSSEQLEVVRAPVGTARKVVAGAGTGKTKTMVERFAHLVGPEVRMDPHRIMVVTFTNKAAAELRERITAKLLSTGQASDRAAVDNAWIGTFHALCTRLLREDSYQVGFDRDIQVINPLEERLLVQDVQSELRDGRIENAGVLEMEAVDVDDAARLSSATFDLIRNLKSRGILPEELRRRCIDSAKAFWDEWKKSPDYVAGIEDVADEEARELVSATYAEYERRLADRKLIDFDGLLVTTRNALRDHPAWAVERRAFFQHLIVDEFQDTNRLQLEVLEALSQPGMSNLEVVGDPRQSIYGWRDAEIENILQFKGVEHELTGNYRSRQPILDAAHHIISQDHRFTGGALRAHNGSGTNASVSLYRGDDPDDEARFVAGRILQLHEDEGRQWSDIAILTRMRRPPIAFEKELRRLGIPYVTGGGYGFFEREEIKDVMAFVRVIDNPLDDTAFVRVLQGPVVRVTDGELYRVFVGRRAGRHRWDMVAERLAGEDRVLESATEERVRKAMALISDGQLRRGGMSISQLLQWVLDQTDYPSIAAADASAAARRMGNLRKLYRLAAEYESSAAFSGLRDFIEYVELHGEHGVEVGEAETEGADAVSFMTIHAAKGLEFPVVFLAHLKPFWNGGERWVMRFDDQLGLVVRKLDDEETPKMLAMRGRGPEAMPLEREKEEMRRLVYVAITRAREQLFVTATRQDEPDWPSVLSKEVDGKARRATEDDYFRNLTLWAEPGGGTLLAAAPPDGRVWTPHPAGVFPTEAPEELPLTTTHDEANKTGERLALSFSTIEIFLQCPLRYRYVQEWKIPAPPDDMSASPQAEFGGRSTVPATVFGTLVHETLEAFHQPGVNDGAGGIARVRSIWDASCEGVLSPSASLAVWNQRAAPMFRNYLESGVASWPTEATEQEFNLVYGESGRTLVRGFIDRLARDPAGRRTVVDYKTGRTEREAHYGTQLQIYKDAMRAQGSEANAILFTLTTGALESPESNAEPGQIIDAILFGERLAPPAPPCAHCSYRRNCPEARVPGPDEGPSSP